MSKRASSWGVFASIPLTKARYIVSPQGKAGVHGMPYPEQLGLRVTGHSSSREPEGFTRVRIFSVKIRTVLDKLGCVDYSVGMS